MHRFVGLAGHQQVLVVFIRGFHPLLVGRHEPVPRLHPFFGLRVVHFEAQRALRALWVACFGDPVARPPNLDGGFAGLQGGGRGLGLGGEAHLKEKKRKDEMK